VREDRGERRSGAGALFVKADVGPPQLAVPICSRTSAPRLLDIRLKAFLQPGRLVGICAVAVMAWALAAPQVQAVGSSLPWLDRDVLRIGANIFAVVPPNEGSRLTSTLAPRAGVNVYLAC